MLFRKSSAFCRTRKFTTVFTIATGTYFNTLKPKEEEKRKYLGESERHFISEGEKEHLVRRYPGNARSSF
jgi:hypothetical protein